MSASSCSGVVNKNALRASSTTITAANGAAQTHQGRRRAAAAAVGRCRGVAVVLEGLTGQIVPFLIAWSIHGMTSSSISSSDVVGLEAEHALGLLGGRDAALHVVLERVVADRTRSGSSGPLIFRQIDSASSSTVVDCAVERLKSSLRAVGCSIAATMPRARSPP